MSYDAILNGSAARVNDKMKSSLVVRFADPHPSPVKSSSRNLAFARSSILGFVWASICKGRLGRTAACDLHRKNGGGDVRVLLPKILQTFGRHQFFPSCVPDVLERSHTVPLNQRDRANLFGGLREVAYLSSGSLATQGALALGRIHLVRAA